MKRRLFIKSLSLFTLIPFLKSKREPYINKDDEVSYIGTYNGKKFESGALFVENVGKWTGNHYMVTVTDYSGFSEPRPQYDIPDSELSCFHKEVPEWNLSNTFNEYNNIHTYVRCKRYGESIKEAENTLNFKQI
jgi:hypothetical protein